MSRPLWRVTFSRSMRRVSLVTVISVSLETVLGALQACGLSGYRNDGEFSVARPLRDVLSSSIMINNERILAGAASSLLLFEVPARVRD